MSTASSMNTSPIRGMSVLYAAQLSRYDQTVSLICLARAVRASGEPRLDALTVLHSSTTWRANGPILPPHARASCRFPCLLPLPGGSRSAELGHMPQDRVHRS